VGQRLVASVAVAAFIPAELCPDHLVAAGTLTPAELLARDLGHERLLYLPAPPRILSPRRVISRSLAELPGEVSGFAPVMAASAPGTWTPLPSP
jgi:hypothetical protein